MANINFVFQRIEKKYLLKEEQYEKLIQRIEPYMSMDNYGKHTICNIYYDTDSFELIRESIEKPEYKEKLRLRSYGTPKMTDKVYLEIKKKYDGIVYKRRISLTLEEAVNYLEYGIRPLRDCQILREIDYFIQFYRPSTKVFLAYDRVAYFGKEDPEVRLTFDTNIRSRQEDLDLTHGDYGTYLLEKGYHLMEIKVPLAMPMWLSRALSELEIYPVSFSKYGNVYRNDIASSIGDNYKQKTYEIAPYSKVPAESRRTKICLTV